MRQGDSFLEPTMNSLTRRVKVRAIINIAPKEERQLEDILKKVIKKLENPKSSFLEFRKCLDHENIDLVIFDNKYTFLGTGDSTDIKEHNLFSDNINLAKLAEHYFEDFWRKSKKIETNKD